MGEKASVALFELVRSIEFVVLGALFGFLGGLFGIGGATLAIPTLGIVFGMTEQVAQGTAVVMAIPNVEFAPKALSTNIR